jgi:hypothetical protein
VSKDRIPFAWSIKESGGKVVEIDYAGYMASETAHIEKLMDILDTSGEPVGLCYTVDRFDGFERAQVSAHASLFMKHRDKIRAIAVVGARPAVHFAAISVGLMSKTPLKSFPDKSAAIAWLGTTRAESRMA